MQSTESSSGYSHRALKGYEVCIHECVPSGCISAKTQTLLWNREGHACRRHACLESMHPNCGQYPGCPGKPYLGRSSHAQATRQPTEIELTLINDIPVLLRPGDAMDLDQQDDKEDPRRDFGVSSNLISYPYQSTFRPFSVIFIPDPTLELHNKSKALHDLAYIQTTLTEYEYNAVKHLEGSVHPLSSGAIRGWPSGSRYKTGSGSSGYRVCIQEWVSPIFNRFYHNRYTQ